MTVQEFFDALPSKVDPAKTAGMNNSFVFDIADVGAWTVTVADGVVSVAEGEHEADCTLSASEETLMKIAERRGEPDDRLHDGQAQDQGRHGRRPEAAEALLGATSAAQLRVIRACTWPFGCSSPGASTCWR